MARLSFTFDRQVFAALVSLWCAMAVPLRADELTVFRENTGAGIRQLLELAGQRQVYLVGDATHGTSEFYRFRQEVSRELIVNHGVRRLVLEIEQDEAGIIDGWLNGQVEQAGSADDLLSRTVRRWPSWIWANREVADFLDWLRDYNLQADEMERVRLFGMDMKAGEDGISETYARLINENPYEAWNFRAIQMTGNVLEVIGTGHRAVVWAHNNHVGDKRADDTPGVTLTSLGQLLRESLGQGRVFIIGSAANEGSYMASSKWGQNWREVSMAPALAGSISHALAEDGNRRSLFYWPEPEQQLEPSSPVYHRGIGVVSEEGQSNEGTYVLTQIQRRYNAMVFFHNTRAIQPLH